MPPAPDRVATRHLARLGLLIILALPLSLARPEAALAVTGSAELPLLCDRAATEAAARTGVPISVLKAISLTETGRELEGQARPWPWTVNMEGKGLWFETVDAAEAYVYEHYKRGARSFDVGCFQINYKWHHEAFGSIAEMFEPTTNALYAARFLLDLYAEKGNWDDAAGAYHSRNPEYADRYKARFAAYRARFEQEDTLPLVVAVHDQAEDTNAAPVAAAAPPRAVRVNTYPLLQGGGETALGSLVPLGARAAGSLFARAGAS